jgi:hypothetical protein
MLGSVSASFFVIGCGLFLVNAVQGSSGSDPWYTRSIAGIGCLVFSAGLGLMWVFLYGLLAVL